MNVAYQRKSQIIKRYQWNLKTDKIVSSLNIYQITKILDYNMFSGRSKQQKKVNQVNYKFHTQPYSLCKQETIKIQEVSIYLWGTTSK